MLTRPGLARRNRDWLRGKGRSGLLMRSPSVRDQLRRADWTTICRGGNSKEPFAPLYEYALDFPGFCRDILGVKLWAKQVEIGLAVQENPRVTVSACYGSGKSFTAACIVLWWIYTRMPALIVTTAPTDRQVRGVLWREVAKLWKRAKRKLPGRILKTKLEISDDQQAMGFTGSGSNTGSGLHEGANVLFIEDEAAGMSAEAVEDFEGLTVAEGSRHLKIGNPICMDGPFWDSFNKPEEAQHWVKIKISALDTPNVQAGKKVVPGLVMPEYVEIRRKRWGEKSPLWITKILGEFYLDDSGNYVIPAFWVKAAFDRWENFEEHDHWPRTLGVDVAVGGSDLTVLYLLDRGRLRYVDHFSIENTMEQARKIVLHAMELGVEVINGDTNGPSKGVWDKVLELQGEGLIEGVQVNPIKAHTRAKDPQNYALQGDELQFAARAAFSPDEPPPVALDPKCPHSERLAKELALRTWSMDKGKIVCQSKVELKSKGHKSPDFADAVELCFFTGSGVWWSSN